MTTPQNFDNEGAPAALRNRPDFSVEAALREKGFGAICGIDEVGRGPIAGPVTAAAVIFDPANIPSGINDSKKLSPKMRAQLCAEIKKTAFWGVGWADEREIEALNIRKATHLAMQRAQTALPIRPDYALIDGRDIPCGLNCEARAIIKGDTQCLSIAAASIIAKYSRDLYMCEKSQKYPFYGWQTNAGYPTKAHISALERYGVTQHHRKTFAPIHNILRQKDL